MSAKARRLMLAAAALVLALAGNAQARQVQPYHYNGESFPAGGSSPAAIAFDGADDTLLVVGTGDGKAGLKISKLHLNGDPAGFSGRLGASSFNTGESFAGSTTAAIASDESGASSEGNFYLVSRVNGRIFGYSPDGTALRGFPVSLPGACGLTVSPDGHIWVASSELGSYVEFNVNGEFTGKTLFVGAALGSGTGVCRIAIDSAENFYVAKGTRIAKYDASRHFVSDFGGGNPNAFSERGAPLLAFDHGSEALFELFDSGPNPLVQVDTSGDPITAFGGPDPLHFSFGGLGTSSADFTVDSKTHRVYVLQEGELVTFAPDPTSVTVPTVHAGHVEDLSGNSATLTGTVDPDRIATAACRFEWGLGSQETPTYNHISPCEQGNVIPGDSGDIEVTTMINGLTKGSTYNFRLSSENSNGLPSLSANREFNAADPPELSQAGVDHVTTDAARVRMKVNPNGEDTFFRVEFGTDAFYGESSPDVVLRRTRKIGFEGTEVILTPQEESQELVGLKPATTYHYRVVAENPAGTTVGPDQIFRTFALPTAGPEGCPNSQARQQTSSASLLDCRAYELVSAPNTGGYDVRSALSPGAAPIPTSAGISGKALYSMRSGTIPGIAGSPTNRGADPYLATRGSEGWSTRYLGIPSTNPFAAGPFASPLMAFDSALGSFAFGGSEICNPCFEDGTTNVPLRLPDGSLVEGMTGSLSPEEVPLPAGMVRAPFSANGSHFIFATKAKLEPGANETGTDATVYSRDLNAGSTEVVSTLPDGETIQNGAGIAELAVSADGTKVLIGELISIDAAGNRYYHLYLHLAGHPDSLDLMPGAGLGASFAGMSEDGSKVYFTTKEALATASDQDADESADLYRADLEGESAVLTRVSTGEGGTGNSDSCAPSSNSARAHWNSAEAKVDCSVAAIAGGGGVAAKTGAIYFLSPERLQGGEGVQNAPNLYLAQPGKAPQFVATLESSLTGPAPLSTQHPFVKTFAVPSGPQSLATDQSAGYLYVISTAAGTVRRFDRDGNPANFSAGPSAGTNVLAGFTFGTGGQTETAQVAVDNSGTATDGDFYVTNNSAAEPVVKVFSRTGAPLGVLSGTSTPQGRFGEASGTLQYPTGVAVAPDGTLYVAGGNSGKAYRYTPSANPVAESDYDATLNYGDATSVAGVLAADGQGNLYAHQLGGAGALAGGVVKYRANQFGASGPQAGESVDPASTSAYLDPQSGRLYTDRGSSFAEYLSFGEQVGTGGQGKMNESRGIAVLGSPDGSGSRVFAATSGNKVTVIDVLPTPSSSVDNPLVLDAVGSADSLRVNHFQTTASGKYSLFTSTLPLTGFDPSGKEEVYRFAEAEGLACASCAQTGATPNEDATLTPNGSSITDDGRVFFTTGEQLTLRDSNEKRDAYEWSEGRQELVSTGTSPSDSELLSVSADGTDAFFFTRQKLVPQDENGDNVRLYDAREGGGFEFGPPQFQCAASDECHGAGTKAPAPLGASTTAGTPGQFEEEARPSKCVRPKVKRRGRCVKPKAHKHKHAHKRVAKGKRGGAK